MDKPDRGATERGHRPPTSIWATTASTWSKKQLAGGPASRPLDRQQKEAGQARMANRTDSWASATRSTQKGQEPRENCWRKWTGFEAPVKSLSGPKFPLPDAPRSRERLDDRNLSHATGESILFLGAAWSERGDRSLRGDPMGAGNHPAALIMGLEQPDEGHLPNWGSTTWWAGLISKARTRPRPWIWQKRVDRRHPVRGRAGFGPDARCAPFLAVFCFKTTNAVFRRLGKLSGGRRNGNGSPWP